jgi:hypothetical protein
MDGKLASLSSSSSRPVPSTDQTQYTGHAMATYGNATLGDYVTPAGDYVTPVGVGVLARAQPGSSRDGIGGGSMMPKSALKGGRGYARNPSLNVRFAAYVDELLISPRKPKPPRVKSVSVFGARADFGLDLQRRVINFPLLTYCVCVCVCVCVCESLQVRGPPIAIGAGASSSYSAIKSR